MYKEIISPILDHLDSETWHIRAREALHLAEVSPITLWITQLIAFGGKRIKDPRLNVTIADITFENPVVVGAGWDKSARAIKGLYALGFAGVEVGSVLLHPQPGNPKPRQFMIGKGVALNRLGFNSPGVQVVAKNLAKYKKSGIPIGISLGKNKDIPDEKAAFVHAEVAKKLYNLGDYFVINVSSPNTPGLRALQDKKPLTEIVKAVIKTMEEKGGRKPLFVKIAPDLTFSAIDDVIDVVTENRLTGIIATNTTINSDLKAKYGDKWRNEMGGLSGDDKDFRKMSTDIIKHIYKKTKGKIVIIGVGGVKDATTALEKIKAGASLVQVVAGIRGEGSSIAANINRGLLQYMIRHKIKNIQDLVGKNV